MLLLPLFIKKLLKGLNIHKATGPDAIPTIFLHDYVEELAPIMTHIPTVIRYR
jgi:hypothetical protein